MCLEREEAFGKLPARAVEVIRLRVVRDDFVVDFDDDVFAFDNHVVLEPSSVRGDFLKVVLHIVQATGFFRIAMRVVDLCFVTAVRPAFLKVLGVEIDPRVGLGLCFDFGLKVKVFVLLIQLF